MPVCPTRDVFHKEPRALEMLPIDRVQATDEERERHAGCHIVAAWPDFVNRTVAQRRREACAECTLFTGETPPTTPLFRKAVRHLHLQQLDLAPPRSDYTAREVAAIAFVHGELERQRDARKQKG